MEMEEERPVWRGSSSHVVNFGTHLLCWALFFLVVPVFISLYKWIENRSRIYEVTTQRIRISSGILTKHHDELELYRVNDLTLVEPFLYRVFGAGNIILQTGDQTSASLTLEAITGANALREEIRKYVEECRARRRVRVTELEG